MTTAGTILKKLQERSDCRNYRKDTDTCRTGCPKIEVRPGDACPYVDQPECPCYKY